MVLIYGIDENKEICVNYKYIKEVINYCKQRAKFKLFTSFHSLFQKSISHYLPSEDSAERLTLKYYEFLYEAREFMKKEPYSIKILENLEKFPLELEPQIKEYYEKIAYKILNLSHFEKRDLKEYKGYMVLKTKPFFVDGKIYYENTITLSKDNANKLDHSIVFSNFPLPKFYSLKINIIHENVEIENNDMPIMIVCDYKISIRLHEFNSFSKLFNGDIAYNIDKSERDAINNYLTEFNMNLLDIVLMIDEDYENFKNEIKKSTSEDKFFTNFK